MGNPGLGEGRTRIHGRVVKRYSPPRLLRLLYYRARGQLIGMTSLAEQRFYTDCAMRLSAVEGAVVDVGCWLCSTAISLAEGLRQSKTGSHHSATSKVYAFDRFVWEAWMDKYLTLVSGCYSQGDSFLPEARQRIEDYSDVIELIEEDLTTYIWHHGPIKLLLVDAMKNFELAKSIAHSFYPSLSKGSVLIHQDFKHYYTPWIHIIQYRLRDYFCPFQNVAKTGTMAFETFREIPAGAMTSALEFASVSDAELEEAMKYSNSFVGGFGKRAIAASHVMYFIHVGRFEKAREVFGKYRAQGVSVKGDFALVQHKLKCTSRTTPTPPTRSA